MIKMISKKDKVSSELENKEKVSVESLSKKLYGCYDESTRDNTLRIVRHLREEGMDIDMYDFRGKTYLSMC